MGCTFTHPRNGDVDPRIFKVLNVDSEGQERNPGKIEITESELILHQKGKNPIRWPLRSLRRYGFDAELFSFESGRRCPTGEGIYAFQCQRAEALFNLLQECIQRAGQDDPAVPHVNLNQTALHVDRPVVHTMDNNNSLRPATHSVGTATTNPANPPTMSRSISQQHADGVVSLQVFPSVPSAHEYINTDNMQHGGDPVDLAAVTLRMNSNQSSSSRRPSSNTNNGIGEPSIQYAQLDLQRSSMEAHVPLPSDNESSQAMYINVPSAPAAIGEAIVNNGSQAMNSAGVVAPAMSSTTVKKIGPPMLKVYSVPEEQQQHQQHEYLNLDLNGKTKKCPPLTYPKQQQQQHHHAFDKELAAEPKITYIEVDFKNNDDGATSANGGKRITNGDAAVIGPQGRSGSYAGDTVGPLKTESYAVIDFNKTAAINAKNTNARDDEGVRKTRHNSSIEELQ